MVKNNIKNGGILVSVKEGCTICGKDGMPLYENLKDRLFSTPGHWSLLKCPFCSFLWMKYMPVAEEMYKVYPHAESTETGISNRSKNSMREIIRNSVLKGVFNYKNVHTVFGGGLLGKIFGLVSPLRMRVGLNVCFLSRVENGNLLDIGCGTGGFLRNMQTLGWNVFGVEPDVNAVERGRKFNNINIFEGTLEKAAFPDETFDAITLIHVIEHLDDPTRTLREIYRILKKDGTFVIITPNIGSLCHKKFRQFWYHLDIPRHLNMFSPKSLCLLAENCQLTDNDVSTLGRSVNRTYAASKQLSKLGNIEGFYKSNDGISKRDKLEARIFQIINRSLGVWFRDCGEEIVMIARKGT
jgi:SAM-dependent methyltransferase